MKLRNNVDRALLRRVLELQCQVCKAMAHPMRLQIVDHLEHGEAGASELVAEIGTSKANLSKHVALLVGVGIVETRRTGRQVFYRLAHPDIAKACEIMRSILFRRLRAGEELAAALGSER